MQITVTLLALSSRLAAIKKIEDPAIAAFARKMAYDQSRKTLRKFL